MSQYRDDFREAQDEALWSAPRIVMAVIALMVFMYAVGFLTTGGDFHERLSFVPPILFLVISNVVMCFGWWKARNAQSRSDVCIAVCCLYLGFPASVWSLILITDRLGI